MRVHIKTTKNKTPVPFDYQEVLVSTFHKWSRHAISNEIASYSLSWLQNGRSLSDSLDFPGGAYWFISFYHEEMGKKLVQGILESPQIGYGMAAEDVVIQETPHFETKETFSVASPILIRKKSDNKTDFVYFDSPEADELMTETLKTKLRKENLPDENVSVKFDKTYAQAKIKASIYKGITNKGSICPIIISGSSEQVSFAWCVGVGHSTGIGFGALK